jgi:hypothetical protein
VEAAVDLFEGIARTMRWLRASLNSDIPGCCRVMRGAIGRQRWCGALGRGDGVTAGGLGALAGSLVRPQPDRDGVAVVHQNRNTTPAGGITRRREDAKTSTVKQVVLDDFTRRPYFVKSPTSVARCASTSVVSVVCRPLSDRAVMRYLLVAGELGVTT